MNRTDLHELLVGTLGLLPDPFQRADATTYFLEKVEWHPARCTSVVRVLYDPTGEPSRLQLCASSDNNNTVLLQQPFNACDLLTAVRKEIEILKLRHMTRSDGDAAWQMN